MKTKRCRLGRRLLSLSHCPLALLRGFTLPLDTDLEKRTTRISALTTNSCCDRERAEFLSLEQMRRPKANKKKKVKEKERLLVDLTSDVASPSLLLSSSAPLASPNLVRIEKKKQPHPVTNGNTAQKRKCFVVVAFSPPGCSSLSPSFFSRCRHHRHLSLFPFSPSSSSKKKGKRESRLDHHQRLPGRHGRPVVHAERHQRPA